MLRLRDLDGGCERLMEDDVRRREWRRGAGGGRRPDRGRERAAATSSFTRLHEGEEGEINFPFSFSFFYLHANQEEFIYNKTIPSFLNKTLVLNPYTTEIYIYIFFFSLLPRNKITTHLIRTKT